jgi:hypothetical protein
MSKTGLPYGISFDTKEVPGKIRFVKVILSHDFMSDKDRIRVDLVDHPLYKQLEQYVLANPSKKDSK